MVIKKITLFVCIILSVLPVVAQDSPDTVTVMDITYDSVQQDSITAAAIYDWWHIQASAGDIMVVEMGGEDGLAPLIGILDTSGNLAARSVDGEPNKSVSLDYTVPADGQYTIVATRVGNQQGTTTGRYALRVRKANPPSETNPDQYLDVTFPCQNYEATTVAALRFSDDPRPNLRYRLTVYGLDGFVPVIRLKFDMPGQAPYVYCTDDGKATQGDTFTLPGETTRTITQDSTKTTAQLIFTGADKAGIVNFTIASKGGASGRYFAVLDGLSIADKANTDTYEFRMGPLAKFTPLTLYMVAAENSRLDPYIQWESANTACDDAGRGDCKGIPSFNKAGVTLHEGSGATIIGDRSDAGLLLAPGSTDPLTLQMGSRANDTYGDYALFFIGELPANQ